MKMILMAAFLGLFFLGAKPASADVVVGVPGVMVVDHHRHYHHRHWHHHYHGGGPVLIVH